jgi:hypothetical protein
MGDGGACPLSLLIGVDAAGADGRAACYIQ